MNIRSITLVSLAALFCVAPAVSAASGELDPSFAGSGMTRVGFGFGKDSGRAVATQFDGKLVIAGASGPYSFNEGVFVGGHFSVARLDSNNVPDVSFGALGQVITRVCPHGLDYADAAANAVRIQADGKIVLAGFAYTRPFHPEFTLARYHANGSLDTGFGPNGTGIVYTDFAEGAMIRDMVIQEDGKIVVVGHTMYEANAGEGAVALARYLTNGLLDATFGNEGRQITTGVTGYTGAHAVTIQPDGKILAVGIGIGSGHKGIDFALYRYTTNGVLDSSFGGGSGKVFTAITTNISSYNYFDSANAVAIQPGNFTVQNPDKILVAGTYRNFGQSGHSVIALARYGLDGTLDATFGNGGIVTNNVGSGFSMARAIMVYGGFVSRKIYVAGTSISGGKYRFLLARYTLAGALDATFNGTGHVVAPIGANGDEAQAIAIQAGKLVVAGSSIVNEHDSDFALMRCNTDGSLDGSFDGDGILTLGLADRAATAKGVAMQADGKTVVAGYADDGLRQVVALARLNADGHPDMSFGKHGRVTTPIGAGSAKANAVAIQPDGRIIAVGSVDNDFVAVRYYTNGLPDASFGVNGIARTPVGTSGAEAYAIALQSDGRIVVAGAAYNGANFDFAIVRYTTNGMPDSSFDTDGKVLTPIGAKDEMASAVMVQPDRRIVVAGSSVIGTAVDIAVVRYHTNGLLDNSFGTIGRVVTDFGGGSHDFGQSLAIQPDGRIVVGGFSVNGPITFAAVRYQTNGVPDSSFDGDGKVSTPVGLGLDDRSFAMALQPDGKILMAGTSTAGGPQFSAVRYTANGAIDESYGSGGRFIGEFANGGENIGYALALDSLGRAVIAGDAGGVFGLIRLQGESLLKISSMVRHQNGRVLLEGVGAPGVALTVHAGDTIGSFVPVASVTPDGQGSWQFRETNAIGSSIRFYRLTQP